MKRAYVTPTMVGERFVANEYVAACGDGGTTYEFNCNAAKGTLYYYPTSDGKIDGVYTGSGRANELGGYTPCLAKHKTSSTNDFFDGFIDYNHNRRQDEGEGVIVWLEYSHSMFFGDRISNWHATIDLDMSKWETAKS